MNNQEYRLGNIVFTDDDYPFTTITFIGKDLIGVEGGESWEGVYNVPLTKEWLLKFGFKQQTGSYYKDGFLWNIEITSYGPIIVLNSLEVSEFDEEYKTLELKYVHQLQNLFFALTGEELTIKD